MSRWKREPGWIAAALTGAYLIAALVGMLHHEPWRDELQAWMVVADAGSYPDVYRNMRYEGNPMLWQTLLYPLTRISHDPAWMQGLHLLIAAGFVWVFARHAPFPLPVRVLFAFGYFTLFEYGLISRGYGLGLLLALLACVLMRGPRPRPWLLGGALFLLANTSLYGMVIAAGLAGVVLVEGGKGGAGGRRAAATALALATTGLLLSAFQIYPEPDNTFFVSWPQAPFEPARLQLVASKIAASYLPVPSSGPHWWNTNLLLDGGGVLDWVLPLLLLGAGALILIRRPVLLAFFAGTNLVLLLLFYLTLLVHARYYGHFFIVLILAAWLSADRPETGYRAGWARRLAAAGSRLERPFLVLVLVVNLTGGLAAYGRDLAQSFTVSGEAARFIRESPHAGLPVVGARDYQVSPLAALLDRPIFYPERMAWGSFLIWTPERRDRIGGEEVAAAIRRVLPLGGGRCLLVLSFAAAGDPGGAAPPGLLGAGLQLEHLATFPPGIVEDERYFLYLARRTEAVARLGSPAGRSAP